MIQDNTAADGGVVYAVQNGDQYIYIYRGKPPYWVMPLAPTRPASSADAGSAGLSRLLSPRYQVVPFHGRDADLSELRQWRSATDARVSVRLMHGPGGQGKTRLAIEFSTESAGAGWTVAQARHRSEVAAAGTGDQQLAVAEKGLLLVVDYADRWPLDDVVALLRHHHRAASRPLRVLLLARSAGTWWQSAAHALRQNEILDVDARELGALAGDLPDRLTTYRMARQRFARVLGLDEAVTTPDPDLAGASFGEVLGIHIKALVDVDAHKHGRTAPAGQDQAELSVYLLDREYDYWRAAHDNDRGPVRTSDVAMARVVFTAILTRSLAYPAAVDVLGLAGLADATAQPPAQILADHARLYPSRDSGAMLEPLLPDRLAEDYLALSIPGHTVSSYQAAPWAVDTALKLLESPVEVRDASPRPAVPDDDRTRRRRWFRFRSRRDATSRPPRAVPLIVWRAPVYAPQAMAVLVETAHRWPHVVSAALQPILKSRPDSFAPIMSRATLSRLVSIESLDVGVIEAIRLLLPMSNDIDHGIISAALVERGALERPLRDTDPHEAALEYMWRSTYLSQAGEWDKALEAALAAYKIYLSFTGKSSYPSPDLARAQANIAEMLAQTGRHKEALLYSRIAISNFWRVLTETRYDGVNLLDFGKSLSALGSRLAREEVSDEALEHAQRAVQVCRALADSSPEEVDRGEIQRALAMSFHTLGLLRSRVGHHGEALRACEESVRIRRDMLADKPGTFPDGLARGLVGLSRVLAAGGSDMPRALTAVDEAIELLEVLVDHLPKVLTSQLIQAYATKVLVLEGLDRGREAAELRQALRARTSEPSGSGG